MIPHTLLDILEDTSDKDGPTSTTFEVTEEDVEVDNIIDIVFSDDEDDDD